MSAYALISNKSVGAPGAITQIDWTDLGQHWIFEDMAGKLKKCSYVGLEMPAWHCMSLVTLKQCTEIYPSYNDIFDMLCRQKWSRVIVAGHLIRVTIGTGVSWSKLRIVQSTVSSDGSCWGLCMVLIKM